MKVTKVSAKIKFELESVNECVAFVNLLNSVNPTKTTQDADNLKATLLTIINAVNGRS